MRSVRFDQIRVAELTVNFLEATPTITVKAAFVNSKTGSTHGWTTGKQWSIETLQKLKELTALMARDLSAVHFDDGGPSPSTSTTSSLGESFGLGETFGEVPQG